MDNKEKFLKEYLCEWIKPSNKYQEAYKLWVKYHYKCERYDQFVCTGNLIDEYGFIKPSDGFERTMINTNASNLISNLLNEAKIIEISNEDLRAARKEAEKLTWKGLQEEYQRLYANQY